MKAGAGMWGPDWNRRADLTDEERQWLEEARRKRNLGPYAEYVPSYRRAPSEGEDRLQTLLSRITQLKQEAEQEKNAKATRRKKAAVAKESPDVGRFSEV